MESLGPAIVERSGEGVWIDVDHPTFIELRDRFAGSLVPVMKEPPKPALKPKLTAEEKSARKAKSEAANRERFHRLWRELHTATAPDQKLIDSIRASLPCGDCKVEFRKWKPDFANWEQSVLGLHNAVNAKLGRAAWTLEQSRERWKS